MFKLFQTVINLNINEKVIITILIFISSLVLIEIFDLVSLKKSEKIKTLNIIKTSYHDLKLEYIDVPVFLNMVQLNL